MIIKKKIIIALALLFVVFAFNAPPANAKGGEYEKIVKHLKTKYQAKKVKIPFMFLARFRRQRRASGGREKFQRDFV